MPPNLAAKQNFFHCFFSFHFSMHPMELFPLGFIHPRTVEAVVHTFSTETVGANETVHSPPNTTGLETHPMLDDFFLLHEVARFKLAATGAADAKRVCIGLVGAVLFLDILLNNPSPSELHLLKFNDPYPRVSGPL